MTESRQNDKAPHRLLFTITVIGFIALTIAANIYFVNHAPVPRTFVYRENMPYYITIDEDGYLWLGDKPKTRLAPIYDRGGRHHRVGKR